MKKLLNKLWLDFKNQNEEVSIFYKKDNSILLEFPLELDLETDKLEEFNLKTLLKYIKIQIDSDKEYTASIKWKEKLVEDYKWIKEYIEVLKTFKKDLKVQSKK